MTDLFNAFTLGLVGGIMPGIVTTAMFIEVLRNGFFAGIRVIFFVFLLDVAIGSTILIAFFVLPIPEFFAPTV